jgi:SAM-dependent methyltransferase
MRFPLAVFTVTACVTLGTATAAAQQDKPFEPEVGQPGKDVVWVPTPPELVEKMLDLAELTPDDYLIDLGSGDGRIVIAAARRGARALGVEYSINMVALSRRNAEAAGVADRATFVRADMYEADISKATVMGLFLLPGNMFKLREKFLALAPGSRIVANEYGVEGWEPDKRETLPDCTHTWCTALLWIVPARVHGTWQTPDGELVLEQEYQMVTGGIAGRPVAEGRLRGDEITFRIGDAEYAGRAKGDVIEGTVTRGGTPVSWRATRSSR